MCVSKDNNPFLLNRLQTQVQAQQSFTNTAQWLLCLQALFWLCLPRVSSTDPFQCVPLLSRELWFTLTCFFMLHPRLLLGNNPQRCTWLLMSPPNLPCPFFHGQAREWLKSWTSFNQKNRDIEGWTWWFWSYFPTLMIPWFYFFSLSMHWAWRGCASPASPHLVTESPIWHMAHGRVTHRCPCVQGWGFHCPWKCYLRSCACPGCLSRAPPAQGVGQSSRFSPGFVQDLFPGLWENVDMSWQVANKIYTVQNMPELSKECA